MSSDCFLKYCLASAVAYIERGHNSRGSEVRGYGASNQMAVDATSYALIIHM